MRIFIYIVLFQLSFSPYVSANGKQPRDDANKKDQREEPPTKRRRLDEAGTTSTIGEQEVHKAEPPKHAALEEEEEEIVAHSPKGLQGLSDEIKLKIIYDYIIDSPHWKKVKSFADIQKLIYRRSLAQANAEFRSLFSDPALLRQLKIKFAQTNPDAAFNELLTAISTGNIKEVTLLVKAGVPLDKYANVQTGEQNKVIQMAPIDYAIFSLQPKIFALLLKVTPLETKTRTAQFTLTTLFTKRIQGSEFAWKTMWKMGRDLLQTADFSNIRDTTFGRTGLHWAVLTQFLPLVGLYLDARLNPLAKDGVGHTAIDLIGTVSEERKLIRKTILEYDYSRLLYILIFRRDENAVRELLQYPFPNINVNFATKIRGETVSTLSLAKRKELSQDIIDMLVKRGAKE